MTDDTVIFPKYLITLGQIKGVNAKCVAAGDIGFGPVAEKLGVSKEALSLNLRRLKLSHIVTPGATGRPSPITREMVQSGARKHPTMAEAARAIGMKPRSMADAARRFGLVDLFERKDSRRNP